VTLGSGVEREVGGGKRESRVEIGVREVGER
jgi:hypothetical protein